MKHPKRWMVSARAAAEDCRVRLPFERGAPRRAMIARRTRSAAANELVRPMPRMASRPAS